MAIRYTKPYDTILDEMCMALEDIPDCYETFEMTSSEWDELAEPERDICIRTLADDLFYVLGFAPRAEAGSGKVAYDEERGVIKIAATPRLVHVVALK